MIVEMCVLCVCSEDSEEGLFRRLKRASHCVRAAMREENKRAINESSSLSPFLSLACVNTNQPLDGSLNVVNIYNSPFRLE